jgi:hypothetical protein
MPKPLPNGPTQWEPADLLFLPFRVNALSALQAPLTAMTEFNGKLCDSAAQFGAEWVGFLSRRVKEDWAVPQRMAACTTPQEFQQVYLDYWSKAFSEYREEFGRLARLGELVSRETASTLQKHAEAMTSESRLAA